METSHLINYAQVSGKISVLLIFVKNVRIQFGGHIASEKTHGKVPGMQNYSCME